MLAEGTMAGSEENPPGTKFAAGVSGSLTVKELFPVPTSSGVDRLAMPETVGNPLARVVMETLLFPETGSTAPLPIAAVLVRRAEVVVVTRIVTGTLDADSTVPRLQVITLPLRVQLPCPGTAEM